MTRLTITGRLTAAEDRRIKGWLLPFGRPGYTNLGRVVVPDASHITVPDDASTLFASLDHLDARDNVATFATVEARPEGLWAEWDVPLTHGGDKLLAEYAEGKRTGISVELEPVTIRDGIAAGTLIGCAFPERPAFDGARLVAELAPDVTPDDHAPALLPAVCRHADGTEHPAPTTEDGTAALCETAGTAPAPTDPAAAGAGDTPADTAPANPTEDDTMTTPATAPAALLAGATSTPTAPAPAGGPTAPSRLLAADASPADFYRLLASFGDQRGRLLAALSDIIPANTLDRDQPQWLGEVWSGNAYTRRIVPLLTSAELTDLVVKGWRWTTKPKVGRYAGDKTAVPSNAVGTEPYAAEAQRFAGAHDIDIKYRHFNDAAFFASYFAAMSESYARETDAYALEQLKAQAEPSTLGSVPANVPAGWAAVVDLALDVIEVGTPSFALIEKSLYREMFLTGTDKFLEFLNASMGFEEGQLNGFRLIPVATNAAGTASATGLDRGEVIVGTKAAAKFHELGGGTPLRVDAVNIANGGVDEGVFGYALASVEDARGVRIADLTADA